MATLSSSSSSSGLLSPPMSDYFNAHYLNIRNLINGLELGESKAAVDEGGKSKALNLIDNNIKTLLKDPRFSPIRDGLGKLNEKILELKTKKITSGVKHELIVDLINIFNGIKPSINKLPGIAQAIISGQLGKISGRNFANTEPRMPVNTNPTSLAIVQHDLKEEEELWKELGLTEEVLRKYRNVETAAKQILEGTIQMISTSRGMVLPLGDLGMLKFYPDSEIPDENIIPLNLSALDSLSNNFAKLKALNEQLKEANKRDKSYIEGYGDTSFRGRAIVVTPGPQLIAAKRAIISNGSGMIIYLEQEGRNAGLTAKAAAYRLDAVEKIPTDKAYNELGLDCNDLRDYHIVLDIFSLFKINKAELMTNNPKKFALLTSAGIEIIQKPISIPPTEHNLHYLITKKNHMGHEQLTLEKKSSNENHIKIANILNEIYQVINEKNMFIFQKIVDEEKNSKL